MYSTYLVIHLSREVISASHWSPLDKGGKAKRRRLRVAYTLIQPYVLGRSSPPAGLDGAAVALLGRALNLRVTFGPYASNLLELLEKVSGGGGGAADVAVGQATFSASRYRLGVDLSAAITQRTFYFFRSHPSPVDSFYTLALPLTKGVWVAVAFSVLAVFLSLSFLNWYYECFSYLFYSALSSRGTIAPFPTGTTEA